MKTFVIALMCLLYGGFAKKKFVKSKVPVTEKPHIVFILADDLGWNEVLIFLFLMSNAETKSSDFLIISCNVIREGYRQKVSCFTPNSFVMVNYKTFHLKHHIVFVKICPPTGRFTF